jgi:uncharacterized protein (DUF1778 family)
MPTLEKTNTQISRLNFRLPVELKERIEKAAIISGVTVTDFAISILDNSANEVLEKHQTRTLSNRDRDIYLEMLENPPQPNEALINAVKEYKARVKK